MLDKKFTKACGLIRVSTGDQNLSVEAQKADIERFAAKNGLTLVATFTDFGISGTAKLQDRKALMEALETVSKDTCLIVSRFDRLARSGLMHAVISQQVAEAKSAVYSASEDNRATPEAEFTRAVLRAVSALERSILGERTRKVLAHKRITGRKFNKAKYGYTYDVNGAAQELCREQEVLAFVRTERASGMTFTALAEQLNENGNVQRNGKPWSRQTIRIIHLNDQKHRGLVGVEG